LLRSVVPEALRAKLLEMRRQLADSLIHDGVDGERHSYAFSANMRYVGQFHDIVVPLPDPSRDDWWNSDAVVSRFHAQYEQAFGHADADRAVEIVAIRGEGQGKVDKPQFGRLVSRGSGRVLPRRHREILFDDAESRTSCPVYAREDLLAGDFVQGPAIISQSDTTVLLRPEQTGRVDAVGVIHVRSGEVAA